LNQLAYSPHFLLFFSSFLPSFLLFFLFSSLLPFFFSSSFFLLFFLFSSLLPFYFSSFLLFFFLFSSLLFFPFFFLYRLLSWALGGWNENVRVRRKRGKAEGLEGMSISILLPTCRCQRAEGREVGMCVVGHGGRSWRSVMDHGHVLHPSRHRVRGGPDCIAVDCIACWPALQEPGSAGWFTRWMGAYSFPLSRVGYSANTRISIASSLKIYSSLC